jgi:hypothetical protein
VAAEFLYCRRCDSTKDAEEFSRDCNRKSGRYAYCKECVRKSGNAWYAANRERESAKRTAHSRIRRRELGVQARRYGRGALGGKSNAQRQAEYRDRHPERAKESQRRVNRLYGGRYDRAYRTRHPEMRRLKSARWHARAKLTTPCWADKKAIRAIYAFASNLQKTTGERVHVDHIVPLHSKIVCGLHCEANLQILAASENSTKGNRCWPDMPT